MESTLGSTVATSQGANFGDFWHHDRYEYSPLDISSNKIRLLRLIHGSPTDVIKCEVFETSLDEANEGVPYDALSYTWGDVALTSKIRLNDHDAWVTHNLSVALSHLRLLEHDRILWIDALCIDQNNPRERGHQVRRMSHIYQNAEQVLIWLGEGTPEISALFGFMKHSRAPSRALQDQQHPNESMPLMAVFQKALADIFEHDWFRRVWILQEVANAKRATISCGTSSISSRLFVRAAISMSRDIDQHVRAVLDIMPSSSRQDSWWSKQPKLETLLLKFHATEASDQRDKVYALLGLSSDASHSQHLQANYEMQEYELVRVLIVFMLFPAGRPGFTLSVLCTIEEFLENMRERGEWTSWLFDTGIMEGNYPMATEILRSVTFDVEKHWRAYYGMAQILRFPTFLKMVEVQGWRHDASQTYTQNLWNAILLLGAIEAGADDVDFNDLVETFLSRVGTKALCFDNVAISLLTPYARWRGLQVNKVLLDHGAVEDLDGSGLSDKTLLFRASEAGDVDMVTRLIDRGVSLEWTTISGHTALMAAIEVGDESVVQALLDGGANANHQARYGQTPLTVAATNADMVKLLQLHGAVSVDDWVDYDWALR